MADRMARHGTGRAAFPMLLAFAVLLLAACGSNAKPTTTVTVAGTPSAAPTVAQPTAAATAPGGEAGSFVAFCPAIRVRVLAPPRLMQIPSTCQGNSLFLTPNIVAPKPEFLTVFRYTGDGRGQTATGWADLLEEYHRTDTASGDVAWGADGQPTPRQTGQGTPGFIGQFTRTDKGGVRYAGTLWTGAVGPDTVAILLQGASDQRAALDADMAQILRTVELNAS
jgi:hypothetical protein